MRASALLGLAAGVAAVALLPLYGDPGPASVVSHPEWARQVLRGLDLLSDSPGVNDTAAQVFASLSGRESRSFAAEQYVRASRVELQDEDGGRRLRSVGGVGEAVYAMSIARAGQYRVRFRVAGPAQAEAELTRAGENAVLRRFGVPAAAEIGWVDTGSVYLDPGAYETAVLLPEGGSLQYVEVAPPCVHPIEPPGGWKSAAVTTTREVAVTVLQALDLESELPPAAAPIEFHGSDLRLEDGARAVEASTPDAAFDAGPRGARVLLIADVPADGLYTLSAFGVPTGGHRWLVDGCRTCVVCPAAGATPAWRPILSARLQKGRHVFAATLGPRSRVERMRLEPKKDAAEDYVAALERLGLVLGADGPVVRAKADEARRFIEAERARRGNEQCGDALASGELVADLAAAAGAAAGGGGGEGGGGEGGGGGSGGGPPGGGGGGSVPPPIPPPVPPASPTLPTAFARR